MTRALRRDYWADRKALGVFDGFEKALYAGLT
jgi:hypothetical protein